MPVVERYIEAGHAAIKKKTLGRQWRGRSAVVISMARRLPDLLSHIQKHPDMLHDIALCFARARRRRDLPALLHVESHPEVLRVLSTKPLNQHKLEVCLKRILYRTDPAGMLLDVPRARQQNEAAKRRRMKADRAALHQKHGPVTASTVILHAFLQHFEVVAQSDAKAVFTMPVPGDCPLVLHDVAGLMQTTATAVRSLPQHSLMLMLLKRIMPWHLLLMVCRRCAQAFSLRLPKPSLLHGTQYQYLLQPLQVRQA